MHCIPMIPPPRRHMMSSSSSLLSLSSPPSFSSAPRSANHLSRLVVVVIALCCVASFAPRDVRADYYDMSNTEITKNDLIPLRRVIAMYSLADSPTFMRTNVPPYIQLDLVFTLPGGLTPKAFGTVDAPSKVDEKKKKDPVAAPVIPPSTHSHSSVSFDVAEPASKEKPASALLALAAKMVQDSEAAKAMKDKEDENAAVAPVVNGSATTETVTAEEAAAERDAEAKGTDAASVPRTAGGLNANKFVQVLILQDASLDALGHQFTDDGANKTELCCSQELYDVGTDGCNEVGTLIVKKGYIHKTMNAMFLPANPKEARLSGNDARYNVTSTGEHILIFAVCDPRLIDALLKDGESKIVVSGAGTWMNPYGYLPGRLFGFLPFYFTMFILYLAITLTWLTLNFFHRKEIAGIQHFISVALFLTLLEVLAWFVDYHNFNRDGVRHTGGVIVAILLTALRLTVSRMLVVSVSIGYPVVRPSLSLSTKIKIGFIGLIYFISEAALEVVTRYAQTESAKDDEKTAERWRMFLSIPVALLNALFYWWIFTSLHDLVNYLEQEKQAIKLTMYTRFSQVLKFSLLAAVAFAIYQIYYVASDSVMLHWSRLWLVDGGFQLIVYSVIFLAMAVLWRPSSDSRRYAYAELNSLNNGERGNTLGSMDEDDEFGEIEMGETGAPVNEDNAKFTVEEEEEEEEL